MKTIIQLLAEELGCKEEYVNNVVTLLDEGNTIPFIARYRKEAHGAMDDTALRTLETRLQYLRNLQQRRDEVKSAVEAQGKLTDELARSIDNAATLAEVEDLYRPYKQKRRTRATIAKEKGLEPLADAIFAQDRNGKAPEELAKDFCKSRLGRGDDRRRAFRRERHYRRADLRRRGASQEPARADAEKRPVRKQGREGRRGLRLPALLRLPSARLEAPEPSGAGPQPGREGGLFEGRAGSGPDGSDAADSKTRRKARLRLRWHFWPRRPKTATTGFLRPAWSASSGRC